MNYFDPKNWHEAANLFPLLPPEDLHELAQDISENGLLNPVVVFESKVLDGRNRLLACKEAGVKPVFTEWKEDGVSPVAWVVSLNLKRRHLTPAQRAAVSVEAMPLLEAEAKERSLANLRRGTEKPRLDKTDHSEKHQRVRAQVAKQFDCSAPNESIFVIDT